MRFIEKYVNWLKRFKNPMVAFIATFGLTFVFLYAIVDTLAQFFGIKGC